jgi:hypothetical protein
MNPTEAGQLLAHAAAFDNRRPSVAAAQAWAAALHDIPLDADALGAVARYYGTAEASEPGGKWLQPHHVRRHRQAIRDERLGPPGPGLSSPLPPPADPDNPREYIAALRAQEARIAAGVEQVPAIEGGAPTGYDDNPHVQKILTAFRAEQDAAARRKAQEAEYESQAIRAYVASVEQLLALPDRGAKALAAARDELYSDDEAARGYPLLTATAGVHDEHKVTIRAAWLVTQRDGLT